MTEIILGIGSNVGNKLNNIKLAIQKLVNTQIISNVKISNLYESKALLPDNAPKNWDINFYNLAICAETTLTPQILLSKIKNIEAEIGRINRGVWSPREIDIDILAYGDNIIKDDNLTIPHKFFIARPFAILPALEVAPNWKYPVKGIFYKKTLKKIVNLIKLDNNECWQLDISFKI